MGIHDTLSTDTSNENFRADAKGQIILLAPDSFKGSLTASEAAEAMRRGALRARPASEIRMFPMADGGEGTIEALITSGGERKTVTARDARGIKKEVACGVLPESLFVIETAQIAGILDAGNMSIDTMRRTTLGLGDAIRAALDAGALQIAVGLGGSATNDAGAGMLVALGARLLDERGKELPPAPLAFDKIARIDLAGLDPRLKNVKLMALSDVDSPLTGPLGATAVFGPQKGVEPGQVEALDAKLAHFADCLESAMSKSARDLPGSGAAGGLGFALRMLGAELRPGAEAIADAVGLDAALADVALVLTGEGASDRQTLCGKAPFVVSARARRLGKPTVLLSGLVDPRSLPELNAQFLACFSCVPGPVALGQAIDHAAEYLENATEQVVRIFRP